MRKGETFPGVSATAGRNELHSHITGLTGLLLNHEKHVHWCLLATSKSVLTNTSKLFSIVSRDQEDASRSKTLPPSGLAPVT